MTGEVYLRRRASLHLQMARRASAPYIARLHVELACSYLERIGGVPAPTTRHRPRAAAASMESLAHPPRIRG
jgi:hypothetical protein